MTDEELKKLRQLLSEPCPIDCGDNGCRCAYPVKGMRTNGGCRCMENVTTPNRSWTKLGDIGRALLWWKERGRVAGIAALYLLDALEAERKKNRQNWQDRMGKK